MKRRTFLKGSIAGASLAVAAGAGLLIPGRVFAAAWPEAAMDADSVDGALNAAFGSSDVSDSDEVQDQGPLAG